MTVGAPIEVRTGHLPNTSQTRYRFGQLSWQNNQTKNDVMGRTYRTFRNHETCTVAVIISPQGTQFSRSLLSFPPEDGNGSSFRNTYVMFGMPETDKHGTRKFRRCYGETRCQPLHGEAHYTIGLI
jgi:hypothetical protein